MQNLNENLPSNPAVETSGTPPLVKQGVLLGKPLIQRGDSEPTSIMQMLEENLRFDYFQVTMANDKGTSTCMVGEKKETYMVAKLHSFFERLGMRSTKVGSGGKHFVNRQDFAFLHETDMVATVNSGSRKGQMPMVTIPGGGGACDGIATEMQAHFKSMLLARADVSLDIDGGSDGFRRLLKLTRQFAQSRRMKPPIIVGAETPGSGRTINLGSRKNSRAFLRIYEKGRKSGDKNSNWLRIEFELKGFEAWQKSELAKLSPVQLIQTGGGWARTWLEFAMREFDFASGKLCIRHMEVQKPRKMLMDKARRAAAQARKSNIELAIVESIAENFDGDWAAAVLDAGEIYDAALTNVSEFWREEQAAEKAIEEMGLNVAQSQEDRSGTAAARLRRRHHWLLTETAEARCRLSETVCDRSRHEETHEAYQASASRAREAVNKFESNSQASGD